MYSFNARHELIELKTHIFRWFAEHNKKKAIVGVSGGVDSSVTLAVACEVLGPHNVLAVMMPNYVQEDIACSHKIIKFCGCDSKTVNIGAAYDALSFAIYGEMAESICPLGYYDAYRTNTPARLRMTVLYGISAVDGGIVLNTCNLSEDVVGYSTLYGDSVGGYAVLQGFTKTEVKLLGKELGIPEDLIEKVPTDGMSGTSDEEKLSRILGIDGFTYDRLDHVIRNGWNDNTQVMFKTDEYNKLFDHFVKNYFKQAIIHLPHYEPNLKSYFYEVMEKRIEDCRRGLTCDNPF